MTHKKTPQNSILRYFLTGFAMGSADIVPGVSGGTIAFIAGIYEKLINSIKDITSITLRHALKFEIKEMFASVPFSFLVPLGLGLLTAVFTLSKALEFALSKFPVYIWSFFFGLIVASAFIVRKRLKNWTQQSLIIFAAACAAAYIIVGLVPVETPATLLAFFLSGMIAIMAMILPGISGSFLLVIMGKYSQILGAVSDFNFVILITVGLGAVIGLSIFSRVLSWLFKHHHDVMIAALTGLMIGSLRKVWPWKNTIETYVDSHGEVLPLVQQNILPNGGSVEFIVALILGCLGFALILMVERFAPEEE